MADLDRIVAGVSCREVLAHLADLVDGTLAGGRAEALRAHVAACDVCESFGGRYARLVAIARGSGGATSIDADVASRLRARLRSVTRR